MNEIVRAQSSELEPATMDDVLRLAKIAAATGFYGAKSVDSAVIIMLTGKNLGLSALQSLGGIHVIEGKPCLSADLMVAVVRRSGLCESWRTVESTASKCTIETKRRDDASCTSKTWTVDDAKRAQLSGKSIWLKYPAQMLRHRCASDLAREVYPEVMLGLYTQDEVDNANDGEVIVTSTHPVIESVKSYLPTVVSVESAAGVYVDHEADMLKSGVDSGIQGQARDLLTKYLEDTGHRGVKVKFNKAVAAEQTRRSTRTAEIETFPPKQIEAPAPKGDTVPEVYGRALDVLTEPGSESTVEDVAQVWIKYAETIAALDESARKGAWQWACDAARTRGGTVEDFKKTIAALKGAKTITEEALTEAHARGFTGADDAGAWALYLSRKQGADFALMGSLAKRRVEFERRDMLAARWDAVVNEIAKRTGNGTAAANAALTTFMNAPSTAVTK